MAAPNTNVHDAHQGLEIEVLVKNDRVIICKITGVSAGPFYMHYHVAAGWKDLDHGDTLLSRRMPAIVSNPFELV